MTGCFSIFRRGGDSEHDTGVVRQTSQHVQTEKKDTAAVPSAPLVPATFHEPCCGWGQAERGSSRSTSSEPFLPAYTPASTLSSEVRDTIADEIKECAPRLTKLSLWLSDHPEMGYEEHKAHAHITAFLEEEGFDVKKSYKLPTAFRASFKHDAGKGAKMESFGLNSEYDALPGVGHACGHNLIAVSGVAALIGLRAAMRKHGISGEAVLLGTPAEEGGVGKGKLLAKGAYDGLGACMMIHPTGEDIVKGGAVVPTLAITTLTADFYGRTAHAGAAPWEGINALDAANLAYGAISALRQQIKTTDRVHGIITRGGDAPNIIPDHTTLQYYIRSQSAEGVEELLKRVQACFDGAAKATGCKVKFKVDDMMYDLRNNVPLADEYAAAMGEYKQPVRVAVDDWSQAGGSTDFGNVTYALPAAHPMYGIPSIPGRANHTPEFRNACRSEEAHKLTYKYAAGMACVGARFLNDAKYAREVKSWFDEHKQE